MSSILRIVASASILALTVACNQPPASAPASAPANQARSSGETSVERGRYLATISGCDDCHTPKKFGPAGPEPDMTRRLSGHPSSEKLSSVPPGLIAPDKWGAVTNNHLSAWVGPWGTSFARNLTPDVNTGLGSWTEDMFVKTIRNGKHQGEGRDILPPMPWQDLKVMTDEDLKSVWAFLRSLPAITNAVPDPVPPEGAAK